MSEGHSISSYAFVFTAIVTVCGWFVVASQADKRERRNVLQTFLNDARDHCEKIRELAVIYWLENKPATRDGAAESLKAEIRGLGRLVRAINNAGIDVEYEPLISNIRSAATGGSFETKSRKKDPTDKPRVSEIAGASEDLLDALFDAYFLQYPIPQRWHFLKFISLSSFFGAVGDVR